MSDSDEILFDDIYELHEVIGKDFLLCTTMYFIKRYTTAEEVVASLSSKTTTFYHPFSRKYHCLECSQGKLKAFSFY